MTEQSPVQIPSHVVGIGASAGGLDALERFFDQLPLDTGMAFVLVQHLSPDFKSLMAELLGRHTDLPIKLVEDGMLVEANHVYLIPPKKEMIISDGKLLLSERDLQQELTLPIDLFFRSLAEECGPRAVAIVLSGGGSDGSRGIRAVHDAGGHVIVQDGTAQFDGMPRTARDAGVADRVLAPHDMPQALLELGERRAEQKRVNGVAAEAQGLAAVYRMLQDEYGIDFTHYKPSTVTRRIERRLGLARSQDVEEYVRNLSQDRAELDLLYRDLLIGVTRFFRDPEAFALLEQQILPELFQKAGAGMPIRIWVAGCATGEEAYSIAIACSELMARVGERPVKIFATDVHPGSLGKATRGIYDADAVAGVPQDRLDKYFTRVRDEYQVVPEIRQMVVFAAHNVIKDPPFTRVDLITCRNLLIYLKQPVQQKVLLLFHFALHRGGALLLGPSESVGHLAHDFESVDKHWQLYRKPADVRLPVERVRALQPEPRVVVPQIAPTTGRYSVAQLLNVYDGVLDTLMPPSLLVNERAELVHSFAGASKFLRPRDGRQGLDLLDLVEGELKMVLVGGLKRALHESSTLVFKGVRVESGGMTNSYQVTIRPIPGKGTSPHLLVTFDATEARDATPPTREVDLDRVSREQLATLESQLSHTRENLQSAIEELEASNEELQASNEELQASNEELQSTNEELQSVNEELYTVNAEYQRKIAELTELTNDMDNLLSSTEVGTIFLDRELRIRKFTPQIAEAFQLVAHDVGRPIDAFAHKMDHPELVEDLKRVISSGARVERELRDGRGQSFFLRILPYRAKGAIEGVLLTLIDVSGLKAAEDALFHERYLLNSLLMSVPDAIYFKDARGRFIRANHAMAKRLGLLDPRDAVGKTAFELPDQKAALALHQQDERVLRTGDVELYKLEGRDDGRSQRWDLVTRLPLRDPEGSTVGVIVIFRDVTEQKDSDEKIMEAIRRRDQFLAMLSHELRNPLGAIVSATALLRQQEGSINPERLLAIVERQSKQMARLLDDLLEASRVTQNKIELRRRIVDLVTVAHDAADAVRGQFEQRDIHFTVDLDSEMLKVFGDPARLQQIHVNLLSNAAKYTQRGGHVSLEVRGNGGEALIRVRDDGAGIPQEMLTSVFDLFVQSHRTLDRSAGGLGLGLTIVRSLVHMHGGHVEVRSDGEGRGSEFLVRLPLWNGVSEDEPKSLRISANPRRRIPDNATVVIVEDNADSREALCQLLEIAGYRCRSTDTGFAGLALIEETKPDVALLDVGLPGLDGYEIARRLRSNPAHADMNLFALTGYGQAQDRLRSREAGFDAHLVKPVDAQELLSMLAGMRAPIAPAAPPSSSDGAKAESLAEE